MSHLKNKIALVTGATRGLGKGIAIGLGEAGATVYITGRSWDASEAKDDVSGSLLETKLAVEEAGGICIPVQIDHKDDDQVESLFNKIEREQQGQLDILVNNAFSGVKVIRDSHGQSFWEHKTYLWDAINNVGLRSHYITSMFAARMMTQRRQGLICTISSWGGMSYIFGAAYGAGKASCDRMAADMAVELEPYNVASVSIWPGIVGTEHISRFADEILTQETSDNHSPDISDRYNWESPLLTGRVIASLAAEPSIMKRTGKVQIVAEIAQKYRLVDADNRLPVSLRSLRFLLPFAIPKFKNFAWLIPDVKIPWFILLWTTLKSPQI